MGTLRQENLESAAHGPAEQLACVSSSAEVWAWSWCAVVQVMRVRMRAGAGSGLWKAEVGASCGLLLLEKDSHSSSCPLHQWTT